VKSIPYGYGGLELLASQRVAEKMLRYLTNGRVYVTALLLFLYASIRGSRLSEEHANH